MPRFAIVLVISPYKADRFLNETFKRLCAKTIPE